MSRHLISDLTDCSEFRQTIAARPPKIIHGTALLLSVLLLSAVAWAALTQANLVVLAQGRIRPQEVPTHVFTASGAESVGRVVDSPFDEGDHVKAGDVLVRLDTNRIENSIAKLTRTIEGSEQELASLAGQRELLHAQALSAEAKAQSELKQAEESYIRAKLKRDSDVSSAHAELRAADDYHQRVKILLQNNASSQQELVDAETKLHLAKDKRAQAWLAVDGSAVKVARQALELVGRDFAVRKAELEARIVVRQSEFEAARNDLASLRLQKSDAVLLSPFDGVIVAGRVRVGDILEPGKPVFELARQQDNCFEAVASGKDVGDLCIGLPVRIRLDAYDYQKYGTLEGTVSFISPDSKPITPDNHTEQPEAATASPLGFKVRVKLHAEEIGRGSIRGAVKLGLGGTAEIITGQDSLLRILLRKIRRTISLV